MDLSINIRLPLDQLSSGKPSRVSFCASDGTPGQIHITLQPAAAATASPNRISPPRPTSVTSSASHWRSPTPTSPKVEVKKSLDPEEIARLIRNASRPNPLGLPPPPPPPLDLPELIHADQLTGTPHPAAAAETQDQVLDLSVKTCRSPINTTHISMTSSQSSWQLDRYRVPLPPRPLEPSRVPESPRSIRSHNEDDGTITLALEDFRSINLKPRSRTRTPSVTPGSSNEGSPSVALASPAGLDGQVSRGLDGQVSRGLDGQVSRALDGQVSRALDGQVSRGLDANFLCRVCDVAFSTQEMLDAHTRVHEEEKPYACEICGKRFTQQGTVRQHMQIHKGLRKYKCSECGRRFNQRGPLRQHMICHTGERPFPCPICPKAFTRKAHLEAHMTIHTGARDFHCEICGKDFSRFSSLCSHQRLHKEAKSYGCNICRKNFASSNQLWNHVRIHEKERPFKCPLCVLTFPDQDSLDRHLPVHGEPQPYVSTYYNPHIATQPEESDLSSHTAMAHVLSQAQSIFLQGLHNTVAYSSPMEIQQKNC